MWLIWNLSVGLWSALWEDALIWMCVCVCVRAHALAPVCALQCLPSSLSSDPFSTHLLAIHALPYPSLPYPSSFLPPLPHTTVQPLRCQEAIQVVLCSCNGGKANPSTPNADQGVCVCGVCVCGVCVVCVWCVCSVCGV